MSNHTPQFTGNLAPASPDEVYRAIAEIERFYMIGHKSLAKYKRGDVYGRMTQEAAKVSLHPEMLRKARVLADPEAGYTRSELSDLCRLIQKHGFWRGRPFGPSHLIRFLTIPRKQRVAFQREAIQGRWSRKHLDAEIRLKFGKRRKDVGRKPKSLASPEEVYYELLRLSEKWLRVCQGLRGEETSNTGQIRKDLRPSVREEIEKIERVVERLRDRLLQKVPEELDTEARKRANATFLKRLTARRKRRIDRGFQLD